MQDVVSADVLHQMALVKMGQALREGMMVATSIGSI